ncbi:MAG: COG1361 S-layer family protein, partial [Candidatus Hermodarchaeota archaeon]
MRRGLLLFTTAVLAALAAMLLLVTLAVAEPLPHLAPTGVESGTLVSQTVPGRPILTIRNFSVEPSRVVVGSEFVVTIEVYNTGSRAGENTLVTFPGGTFVPVGQTGHQLWQLHINHTAVVTQRMRVPSGLASGSYDLRINLSANDYEGNHYDYPQTIAVEVIGVAQGRPRLAIETARTEPAVLVPGDTFSLTLRLANLGSRAATQVMVGAADADLVVPAGGSNMVAVGVVGVSKVATATLSLVLGDVPYAGRLGLEIALDYSDYDGGSYTARQSIGLEVITLAVDRAQLIITAYSTTPDPLAPGDTFALTMEVSNVGGREAQRLALTLGGEGGTEMAPFVPL